MFIQISVYAQKGTKKKLVFPHPQGINVLGLLNEQFGGSWLLVDHLQPGEAISFEDGMEYQGFSPEIKRYSDAIVPIGNQPVMPEDN